MLSNGANYDINLAENEIAMKRLMLDIKVDTQVIFNLLVRKGIIQEDEIKTARAAIKNSPRYKPLYDYLNGAMSKAEYYSANPQEHLRDLFKAKLDGTIN